MDTVLELQRNLDGHTMPKIAHPEGLVPMENLLNTVTGQECPKKMVYREKASRSTKKEVLKKVPKYDVSEVLSNSLVAWSLDKFSEEILSRPRGIYRACFVRCRLVQPATKMLHLKQTNLLLFKFRKMLTSVTSVNMCEILYRERLSKISL